MDSGVPVQGTIVVDTKRKAIQNEKGGTITKILVHEGQVVRAGDLLLVLDSATMQADYESARQRYLGMQAMEDRLVAERQGKSSITYSQKILAEAQDPTVGQHIVAQNHLMESGRRALKSELSAIQESLLGQEEANKGYVMQLESRRNQVNFITQELMGLRELEKDGYAPRNKLLEMERQGAELAAGISELEANLARGKRAVAELKFRKTQKEEEFKRDLDSQLAEVRREVSADAEHVKSTRDNLTRTEIRAPVPGAVVGFVNQTVGGVIIPGTRIMDIIPTDESLMLEAHVPPSQVGRQDQ